MRDFHVRREPRERYAVATPLIGSRGDLVIADLAGIRQLAARMNLERGRRRPIGQRRRDRGPRAPPRDRPRADRPVRARPPARRDRGGPGDLEAQARTRGEPPARPLRPGVPRSRSRAGAAAHRLEELLLTRIANENPALGPLQELVDDRALATETRYHEAIAGLEAVFADGPPTELEGLSLIELMRTPARHAPTSLAGQLRYIRDRWGPLLGADLEDLLRRLDLAIGILAEEERALHLRFGGGTGGPGGRAEAPSFATAADEAGGVLVRFGLDAARRAARQEHLRLARPAVAHVRARHPDARRDPGRGARHPRAVGRHRAVADRPVGALAGVGDGSSGCAATPRPSPPRTRSTTTGSPTTWAASPPTPPCATGPRRAASASPATWSPTTWGSTRAG